MPHQRPAYQSKAPLYSCIALLLISLVGTALEAAEKSSDTYTGACDGSAAVAVENSSFIVASDEDNVLRTYEYGKSTPIRRTDLSKFLEIKGDKEVDIEGAARIGDLIYWIGSHSRDKKGHKEPDRARLFAVELKRQGKVIPVGKPYKNLENDMADSEVLKTYHLDDASKLPPQEPGGLNIEGLATTQNNELLIGFRNPLFEKKALIVPIANPADIIHGKRAAFSDPILLSLDELGIRSLEYNDAKKTYLILAGPAEGDTSNSTYKVFEWAGPGSTEVRLLVQIAKATTTLQPEALFSRDDTQSPYILSDDG